MNELDSKCDEHVCAPRPALKAAPERNLGVAINPYTKTVQYALYCSNADLKKVWNGILFTKLSDTTLKLFGNAIFIHFPGTSEKHPIQ